MTILEMLDLVESEITRLRAERARLVSALAEAERRLSASGEELGPTLKRRRRSKRSKKRETQPARVESTAASPVPEPAPKTAARKRTALGRGLADLRRTSSPNRKNSPYWPT